MASREIRWHQKIPASILITGELTDEFLTAFIIITLLLLAIGCRRCRHIVVDGLYYRQRCDDQSLTGTGHIGGLRFKVSSICSKKIAGVVLWVRVREEEPAYRWRMRERKGTQTDWRRNALRYEAVYPPIKSYHSKMNSLRAS
ncbi:hypothetical protein EVAR_46637_1 [Eumeta japonica]|uniref:Uncharacterized protein n=1 Tax=Eumeta variegata TaxID=151549 RepID=A0A4C1WIU0_EUMVA|nr:hypothetical protein EVAR_46637_1 [Eumeta japonica]